MSAAPWNLQQDLAHLQLDRLAATLDLTHPVGGLTQLTLADTSLPGGSFLALATPFSLEKSNPPLTDRYIRGRDVAAVYEPTDDWPVRVDALWRAAHSSAGQPVVELVVSVRTSLLASRPALYVHTALPANEILWVTPEDPDPARILSPAGEAALEIDASEGPGCLLLRVAGTDLSYAEMVHPSDFRQMLLRRQVGGTIVRSGQSLFADSLEKGVILRGRVRGLFVPRAGDVEQVAADFLEFAAEEPLLGT